MKELQPPFVSGLAEAVEIQRMIDGQESTDSIKFDEVLKHLPTTEGGAVTTIRYVFCKRYLPFDLACLVQLVREIIVRCVHAQFPRDTAKTLCEFAEAHLTEGEGKIGQSAENTALLWFFVQLRRFLRDQVEEHKPW
jgi:hypothetical protein